MQPKTIRHQNEVLAHYFPKTIRAESGVTFLTPVHYPLQIALLIL
jgi:hypothetical protein